MSSKRRPKKSKSKQTKTGGLSAEVAALREEIRALQAVIAVTLPISKADSTAAVTNSPSAGKKGAARRKKPKTGTDASVRTRQAIFVAPETPPPPSPIYEVSEVSPLVSFKPLASSLFSPSEAKSALLPTLLDRARLQWFTGDWESLAATATLDIEHHPERAALALLASVASHQVGDAAESRRLLALALRWGCDRRAAVRLLWASIHRNIASAHTANRRAGRAQEHLELAAFVSGESTLSMRKKTSRASLSPCKSRLSALAAGTSGCHAVIVIAGMRHSGSTALFNILRLGLSRAGHDFVSCYSEQENCASKVRQAGRLGLIKTHEFRDDLLAMADFVFTTRRDLRDTVASASRRDFPLYKQLRTPVEYAKYNRTLHDIWSLHSDFEFVYESFLADPMPVVCDVLEAASLPRSWAPEICREVLNLPTNDYQTTLLSPQHITDPTHKLTYCDTLAPKDISAIQAHHYDWLQRHGYAVKQ